MAMAMKMSLKKRICVLSVRDYFNSFTLLNASELFFIELNS